MLPRRDKQGKKPPELEAADVQLQTMMVLGRLLLSSPSWPPTGRFDRGALTREALLLLDGGGTGLLSRHSEAEPLLG